MKAIVVTADKTLELAEVPTPQLRAGEVLVKVHATGVNRADLLQAAGYYPPPPGESEIMGLECAGEIVDTGDTDRQVGEKVACLLAGGIGTFAIQLAKHLGAQVAVTAGSVEKLEACRRLGADILINYREENFADVLKNRCDRILDIIGAKYLDQNVTALAPDGHMVIIGMQGGVKGELNIGKLLAKRGTISATALRARSHADKARIVTDTIKHVWPLLADGTITHQLHDTLPLADAARAHELLRSGAVTGTLVLNVCSNEASKG